MSDPRSPRDALLDRLDNPLMHYAGPFLAFLEAALAHTTVDAVEIFEDGALAGFLPYAVSTHPEHGRVVNSLPFFGSHGGPVARDAATRAALLDAFAARVAAIDPVAVCVVENPFDPLDAALMARHGLTVEDDRIGQFTPLPAGMEAFHTKTRNAIRKGQKLGQDIALRTDDAAWDWMQAVHQASIEALGGVPKSRQTFRALRDAFGPAAELWVGSLEGRPVSGVVLLRHRGTVEYFTPVVEEAHRDTQALSATVFHVMERQGAAGATLWNWGGTWRSQEGVYRFKSRWGAEDRDYRYFCALRDPALRRRDPAELMAAFPNFYLFRYGP